MSTTVKETNSGLDHLDIIIADIDSLITNKHDFVAFIIIALGIEFIGNFYDGDDFADFGQSDTRFKTGLTKFFKNNWYKNHSDWLFKNFRGPLIHQYRPSDTILLTSYCKNKASLKLHLTVVDGKTIFVLEQLFSDFKTAIKKLKNDLKKPSNSLNKEKINGDFMAIINIHTSTEDKIFGELIHIPESSGTTKYNPTMLKPKPNDKIN